MGETHDMFTECIHKFFLEREKKSSYELDKGGKVVLKDKEKRVNCLNSDNHNVFSEAPSANKRGYNLVYPVSVAQF